MLRLACSIQLFSKIVRADYLPVDRTYYSERLSNLVDHLLVPDPRLRPKIDMVRLLADGKVGKEGCLILAPRVIVSPFATQRIKMVVDLDTF